MVSAQTERVRGPDTLTQLYVQAPPMPCPCLVRASSATNAEFAVAPITIVDHPVGPVVENETAPLLEVRVEARRAAAGVLAAARASLGGPARYEVTVSVRNVSTEVLGNVTVAAEAAHAFGDAVPAPLDRPGPIAPGATWRQTVAVEVPAPLIGRFTWTASAYGAGPTVEATADVDNLPVLLLLVAVLFVLDLLAIGWRLGRNRIEERDEREPPDDQPEDPERESSEGGPDVAALVRAELARR